MTKRKETDSKGPQGRGLFQKFVDAKRRSLSFMIRTRKLDLSILNEFKAHITLIKGVLKEVQDFCMSEHGGKLTNLQVDQILATPKFNKHIQNMQLFIHEIYSTCKLQSHKSAQISKEREESVRNILIQVLQNQGGLVKLFQKSENEGTIAYNALPDMTKSRFKMLCNKFSLHINSQEEEVAEAMAYLTAHRVKSVQGGWEPFQEELELGVSSGSSSSESSLKRQKTYSSNLSQPGIMEQFSISVIQKINSHFSKQDADNVTISFKENLTKMLKVLQDVRVFCEGYKGFRLNSHQINQILATAKLKNLIKEFNEITRDIPFDNINIAYTLDSVLQRGAMYNKELSEEDFFFESIKNNEVISQDRIDKFIKNDLDLSKTLNELFSSEIEQMSSKPISVVSSVKYSNSTGWAIVVEEEKPPSMVENVAVISDGIIMD